MHQSKIIDLLRNLTPKEIKRLNLFFESPFFNKNKKVALLFHSITSDYPEFSSKKIKKEHLYQKIYPNSGFSDKRFSYLVSDMQKLVESYFIHSGIEKVEGWSNYILLQKLAEIEAEKSYKSASKDAAKSITNRKTKDASHYYDSFLFHSIENEQYYRMRKHAFDAHLQSAIDNLDIYYLSTKLKYCCEIANRRNIINEKYEFRLLDEIILYLRENPSEDIPAIRIYYLILLTLLDGDNESHFEDLKRSLIRSSDKFTKSEARDMYAYAQNYCIKMSNKGIRKYLHELFDLYSTALEKEILFDGRYLSPFTFKNIATLAISIHKFDWVERFIETYKDRIRVRFKENAYKYNMAMLHFAKGQHDRALDLLNSVEFTDIVYNTGAKSLLLRIYYEKKEWEALYYFIDSFRMFLKRNKHINTSQKLQLKNLLNYCRRLTRIQKGESSKIEKLRKEIDQNKQVAFSSWLREKLDELE
ncbi:MAG: hypothetical protein HKN92_08095 [Chitinophagales bacterium]|nr:hypothetical protein [Chitinophagales bacterium]